MSEGAPPTMVSIDAADALEIAADACRRGEPIVLPTDTVYGLAVLAQTPGGAARIFALKGRPAEVPIAVLVDSLEQIAAWVEVPKPGTAAARLVDRFWPGRLTLVLPRSPGGTLDLGGTTPTVGIRLPDHGFVRALVRRVGPLAATSANRHGQPTPPTAALAAAELHGEVPVVVDGGRCASVPSTVVDACDPAGEIRVLREGAIPASDIMANAR